jgi:hypothetical protein
MPAPGRLVRRAAHDDDNGEQGLDDEPAFFCGGMHPAKITDAVLAGRRHVLEISSHELGGRERALLRGNNAFRS